MIGLAVLALGLAAALRVALWAGPIAADPARLRWRLDDGAASQRPLVGRAVLEVLAAAAAVAAVGLVARSSATGVGAALVVVAAAVLAALAQRLDAVRLVSATSSAVAIGAVVVLALRAGGATSAASIVWAVGMAAQAVARGGGAMRLRRRARVPRWQLTTAARRRWAARAGAVLLDAEVVAAVGRAQDVARRARPGAATLRRTVTGRPLLDLARLTGLRVAASWAPWLIGAAIAVRALASGHPTAAAVLLVAAQHVVVTGALGVARAWAGAPAPAAAWALPGAGPLVALAAPSIVLAWALVVAAPTGSPALLLVALLLPPLDAWRQVASARPAAGLVLLSTPAGPLPVQTVLRAVAGHDVLLLALLAVG
ncbi:hypothetical protein K8Z61_13845 [Nocardioides sp. TRM66260-LWL]|uniref:hypothetical protein n=1 Tax=Nocardioides sp. TRM66260-LWL TaxID=2874478 RepID=UPI001CC6934C|nr:hypothetical protein [Nocardioides sp. TRM66260-LWL]MBZ5735575.1 hypothetical protein [Nocardioides sp. TRM66260-LWL]